MSDIGLKEQVMINHLVATAGCAQEQARELLRATHWQLEAALSVFLQDQPVLLPSPTSPVSGHNNGTHITQSGLHHRTAPLSVRAPPINENYRSSNHVNYNDYILNDTNNNNSNMANDINSHTSMLNRDSRFNSILAPANTPATPPNFPDTLLAFAKLSTGDSVANDNSSISYKRTADNY